MIRIELLFDESGKWLGNADRKIWYKKEHITIDDYAEQHGIELPEPKNSKKSKKQVNIDIQEDSHADMERQDHSGDTKVDGDGDSEESE